LKGIYPKGEKKRGGRGTIPRTYGLRICKYAVVHIIVLDGEIANRKEARKKKTDGLYETRR